MEDRLSGLRDKAEAMDHSVKETVLKKTSGTKHAGILGHYQKPNLGRNPGPQSKKYFHQNRRRKFLKFKKDTYQSVRGLQNTK